MRIRLLSTSALATLALASLALATPAGATVLTQNALSRLDRATSLGAAPATQTLRVGISLNRPNPAGETAELKALFDPSSPQFHRFLTVKTFQQRFGVTAAVANKVTGWLRSGGLSIDSVDGSRDYILATGTVSQLSKLLSVDFGRYRFGTTTFVANTRPPTVPNGLPIADVLGLNTFQRFTTMTQQAAALGHPNTSRQATPNVGVQTAEDLWSIYQQPADHTGQGVSVAILGEGSADKVTKDLHQFDTEHKFKQLPVQVVHTPANGKFDDESGDGEWQIDMQAVHGMAPDIDKEVLYFAPTLADSDLTADSATWVNDPNGPPVMNASLGECEVTPLNDALNNNAFYPINGNENTGALPVSQGLSNSSEPAQTKVLQQAVMEGRQFFAASGDAGGSCTALYPGTNGIGNYGAPLTEDPANNPYATGVGGTVLYGDGNTPAGRSAEYAWTHSGGNASPFLTAPDYQQGVANLTKTCVVDSSGNPTNTGKLCRGVPDVAALSGDVISNGYGIVGDDLKDTEGGGTSLASPLWAGMWARVISSAPKGSSYGFANPAIYAIGKDATKYAESFHDITVGSNGQNPALPGYDYVTGFGVPQLTGLIKDVQAVAPARPFAPATTGTGGATGTGTGSGTGSSTPLVGSAPGCKDKQAPTSRFDRKHSTLKRTKLILAGTSADKGCGVDGVGTVAKVAVSIGRAVGNKDCRFLLASGRFSAVRSCLRTLYVPVSGHTSWKFTAKHALPAGHYQLFIRAYDSAGNIEHKATLNRLTTRLR